ncbi:hypothetical protein ABPG75_012241 [Micractinium tetrahymenae]
MLAAWFAASEAHGCVNAEQAALRLQSGVVVSCCEFRCGFIHRHFPRRLAQVSHPAPALPHPAAHLGLRPPVPAGMLAAAAAGDGAVGRGELTLADRDVAGCERKVLHAAQRLPAQSALCHRLRSPPIAQLRLVASLFRVLAPPPVLQGRLGVIIFTVAVLSIPAVLHPLLQVIEQQAAEMLRAL